MASRETSISSLSGEVAVAVAAFRASDAVSVSDDFECDDDEEEDDSSVSSEADPLSEK